MLNIVVSQICHRFTDYKTNLFEIKFATDSQIIKLIFLKSNLPQIHRL